MTISRMLYVDDSGAVDHGLIVYGWIEVAPDRWRHGLRTILELRKQLYRDHHVPPAVELHATKFVNGRTRISTSSGADTAEWKTLGRAVAVQCLETLAACPDIRVGAVWRGTAATGRAYYEERGQVYQTLIEGWNAEHRAADSYAFVSMDGNGDDPTYFNAHRSLPLDTRHLIEDPMMHDSRRSQWVQMADLVAYTAFTHLNRHSGNEFGWTWYEDYLLGKDVNGGPKRV
ncbi:hypothetical protein HDC37_003322 [Microbacterium sp. AK009]|uniref:DUF3800 domain-containing protein n=1 Tax=Microbacterium sp. AK009 TaxID=2723068 RepID=UPI0015C79FF4|nr:DUF3800 domain-containing protein [Microbacterium sp. AK009]NYF18458.1 hypothetical protein [Microbacterium sp. AK009]